MRLHRPRPIQATDDSSTFECGEPTLDAWIRLKAIKNETEGASRTFVSIDHDAHIVAGYYCLSAGSLRRGDAPGRVRRNMPDPVPIVLIGRLAVDARYQGTGLGASLLQDATIKGIDASRLVGARALAVDAMSDAAVRFYTQYDFTLFPESERAMYLLIADAERTIAAL